MITKSEFLNQVHGRIFPLLKKCEAERISALKKWGVGMWIISIILSIPVFKFANFDSYIIVFLMIIVIFPILVGCDKLSTFSSKLKQRFLPNLYEGLGLKEIQEETGIINEEVKIPERLKDLDVDSTNPIEHKIITWINSNLFSKNIDGFC